MSTLGSHISEESMQESLKRGLVGVVCASFQVHYAFSIQYFITSNSNHALKLRDAYPYSNFNSLLRVNESRQDIHELLMPPVYTRKREGLFSL